MKVLWFGGIILPLIAEKEGISPCFKNGWLVKLSEDLPKKYDISLSYIFNSNKDIVGKTESYNYYGLSVGFKNKHRNKFDDIYVGKIIEILKNEKPDIVHIWGTETPSSYAMVEACKSLGIESKIIVSMQGLVSKCFYHYTAYLPNNIVKGYTFRDLIKGNISDSKKSFYKQGLVEEEVLQNVKHVIGRTEWDKACAWDINTNLQYHFNNETLRPQFYYDQWSYDNCEQYSIFCSQGNYPIKGVHLIIEALKRVVVEYPTAHLYVGGKDYMHLPAWKQSNYGKYLVHLIKKYNLEKNVTFTGFLNAEEIKAKYLNSNVFVSPSSIENSPNSLGEAMMLGVPCIASRVGGVHSLLEHSKEGYLYPADEIYMLSYYICKVFENPNEAIRLGLNAQKRAKITHDPDINMKKLIEIYNEII